MNQDAEDRVARLRDRPSGGTDPEDRAATLIRGLQTCDEPSEAQMARIEQGILARAARRSRPSLTLRLALAVLFLVAGVATGKAYELARRAGWFIRIYNGVSPPSEPARSLPPRRPARAAAAAPSPPPATILDQATVGQEPTALEPNRALEPDTPASEPPRRPARAPRRVTAVESEPSALAPTAPRQYPFEPATIVPPAAFAAERANAHAPSEEIRALDRAIALLRRDRDAAAALAALDAYLVRYPQGVLHREARLARLDALLILQRTDEALAELEKLPLDSHRRSTELQVVRAELRSRTDCARAEQDFSAALTHSPDAALLERILYGRGACRAKLRNPTGAAEDLQHYLDRFPNGAHAGWARQWLNTIGKTPIEGG